ncbi:beta-catenin-interacting protein 1 isoform X1 [Hylobates moloch]|uniref:beta-catenin-interacting protein 1 isoform X1 n=1 Tax=Hylobates moloch TaxID=81572 RepID=UPI0013F1C023|nr:beta-catenin-interacting protein 1 isoform X1 [Hylobates moloch]XP_032614743.1 beta-catenin-interacting protein 1 isoform X1 [Hylobates moloch]
MNREGAPGKSPEEMYIQQKVRVLLMLRKMGSNLTASEEEFLRTYAGVVNSQLSQLPPHSIDQDKQLYLKDGGQPSSHDPAVLATSVSGVGGPVSCGEKTGLGVCSRGQESGARPRERPHPGRGPRRLSGPGFHCRTWGSAR